MKKPRRDKNGDFRMPAATCPNCGAVHTGATPLEPGSRPSPGCFSICIQCGDLSEFDENLGLRPVDPDILIAMPLKEREELLRMEEKAKAIIRERKRDS